MRTAVPIDLYCYADFHYNYTVIAVCCNVGKYAQFELPGNFTKLTYNDSISD